MGYKTKRLPVSRVFLKEFVDRYGVPYILHTDQGTKLQLNLFKELCKMLGISKTRTSPYHPQCDGQVNSMNRTIIELLVLNTANPTDTWGLNLGLALMAYRSAVQTSTGVSRHFLMYGPDMRLPIDIMYRSPNHEVSRSQYSQEVIDTLQNVYSAAREKLLVAHKKQKDLQ